MCFDGVNNILSKVSSDLDFAGQAVVVVFFFTFYNNLLQLLMRMRMRLRNFKLTHHDYFRISGL